MVKKFDPNFSITPKLAKALMRIEAAKEAVQNLPITPFMLEKMRKTARLVSTHYSTKIEGNRLTLSQVRDVVFTKKTIQGKKRDEAEVKGYYAALDEVRALSARSADLTELVVQKLHALVMAGGKIKIKPTPYRDGQNVIRDGASGAIVYLPPEAKDVSKLMKNLIEWIKKSSDLPCPIVAGIVHYQFVTIHPYFDGNGRISRLLATLILHLCGYDLKGIYSLDEYYARDLQGYYRELTVGPSHNYYMGRGDANITSWIEYFCEGVAQSFENVQKNLQVESIKKSPDQSLLIRMLDDKQRKSLELFRSYEMVTAKQIGTFFGFQPRTASKLCQNWTEQGFIIIVDPSKKGRSYKLAQKYFLLLD